MIDLRSDTLTTPDEAMRLAMASAEVADDVYGEDPTVNQLQVRVAEMFGKEAALFVPSGTQGNQICIALHTETGDEVIAEDDAHIFHYENAATSVIARAQIHPIRSEAGQMPIDDVLQALRPSAYYYPKTALIAVENTHNRHGGTVLDFEYLKELRDAASVMNVPLHCDGARIWNAMVASGRSALEYGSLFDSMSVCFSKGLGAPIGSAILGSKEFIAKAWRWRKMLGGGMRQSGILAAAALYALDNIYPKLAEDHANAKVFAHELNGVAGLHVDLSRVQTNIVLFKVNKPDAAFIDACVQNDVRLAAIRPGIMRAVFYHQVSKDDALQAADAIRRALSTA